MKNVIIEELETGQILKYPEGEIKGSLEEGNPLTFKDDFRFDYKTHDEKFTNVEILLPPYYYLRGIVSKNNTKYYFSAKINKNTFGQKDYEALLDYVSTLVGEIG